jgi:hypothetical protein
MKKPVITICSSANFYKHVVELMEQLEKMGYKVIIPQTAHKMKADNDFEVSHYKTWFADANDYHKKAKLIRDHFDEVARGDVCLVVNDEKHGIADYIGGNVLMEMALAFYLKKPVVIMNEIPAESPFEEEINGFQPIVLHGKIENLPKELEKPSK